ncbi:hypothetical protein Pfo_010141 [Paulownia fortunei]|nr:hypothetical protein Pfo_010141 [Paulownia fortunei]
MEQLREGSSVSHPPLLNGSNYSYWKNQVANFNSKVLIAIFSAVDENQFKLISICESTKEVWDVVRMSKLQILATRFENLRMEENETIVKFNVKLCDIANEVHALGEKYIDFKLVRKVLRSLPERFAYKVIAIKEVRDLTELRLDEPMGALQTFEMNLNQNKREKNKGIALQVEAENEKDHGNDNDPLSLLTKNFGKFLKQINKENKFPKAGKVTNSQKNKNKSNASDFRKNRRIQCRKCEGFGHIQAECANTLKKMGKSLNTTWSDEGSECSQEEQEEHANNHVALTSIILKKKKQTETLDAANDVVRNLKVYKTNEGLVKQITILIKENEALKGDVIIVKKEIENTMKSIRNLNSGTSQWDEILSIVRYNGDLSSKGTKLQNSGKSSKIVFVKEIGKPESMFEYTKKVWSKRQRPKSKRFVPICHFCQIPGHIKPNCFKYKKALLNGMRIDSMFSRIYYHVAHTFLKANIIDSGWSRHITSDKENLRDYQDQERGQVTFGDGVRAQIIGKGTLNVNGLPILRNVLHVERLKANLISISQLCDQNLLVRFNKDSGQVFDDSNKCILKGRRSSDNCYKLQHNGMNVDPSLYKHDWKSLILNCQYANISFSICMCARYQSNPKESHLKAVKRIIGYVSRTADLAIWYSNDTNANLVGYSDADWAGDVEDRKSTTGECFYLGNKLISWCSKNYNCVSLSTVESKYIVLQL